MGALFPVAPRWTFEETRIPPWHTHLVGVASLALVELGAQRWLGCGWLVWVGGSARRCRGQSSFSHAHLGSETSLCLAVESRRAILGSGTLFGIALPLTAALAALLRQGAARTTVFLITLLAVGEAGMADKTLERDNDARVIFVAVLVKCALVFTNTRACFDWLHTRGTVRGICYFGAVVVGAAHLGRAHIGSPPLAAFLEWVAASAAVQLGALCRQVDRRHG